MICIGHRGACGYEPENTLCSFRKALDMGVDAIELDVYAVDGELVVIHDDTLERTTSGTGLVVRQSLDTLRKLDAGKGERIPTLKEVLDLVDGRVWVNVELKGPGTAEPVFRLLSEFIKKPAWSWERFLVSSFDHDQLKKMRALSAEVRLGVLIGRRRLDYLRTAMDLKADSINFSMDLVSRALVDQAHEAGFKVYVYTVNEPEDIETMYRLGVDGVFTNFPDRVLRKRV